MVDVIIVAILVCIIGGILFYLYRAKKRGEVCIGLPVWQTVHRTLRRTWPRDQTQEETLIH